MRHMAKQGIRSVVVKKYNHHTNHGSVPDDKVNILKRDFETETIKSLKRKPQLHQSRLIPHEPGRGKAAMRGEHDRLINHSCPV